MAKTVTELEKLIKQTNRRIDEMMDAIRKMRNDVNNNLSYASSNKQSLLEVESELKAVKGALSGESGNLNHSNKISK